MVEEKARGRAPAQGTALQSRRQAPAGHRQGRRRRRSTPVGAGRTSPSRIMPVFADWLARHKPASTVASTSATSPPRSPFECRRRGAPAALLLLGLPPQHLNQGARRLDCPGWHRLPLHGFVDGPFHHRPDPDGRRRCGLGSPRALHAPPACLPEPRRRHLFPLRHSRHPPGHRRARQRHLQDPLQRCGGDDRRPAGGRRDRRRAHRPPGRGGGRGASRRGVGRAGKIQGQGGLFRRAPPSITAARWTRCSARCAKSPASPA